MTGRSNATHLPSLRCASECLHSAHGRPAVIYLATFVKGAGFKTEAVGSPLPGGKWQPFLLQEGFLCVCGELGAEGEEVSWVLSESRGAQ